MTNKLSFLFLFLTFVVLLSCSESTSSAESQSEVSELPEGATLEVHDDVPGLALATVASGDFLTFEGDLLEGQKHGTWVEYDDRGIMKRLMTFDRGKRSGVELTFGRTGYVESKAKYINNVLHGEYKIYDRRRVTEVRNYKNGKLHGIVKKFYTTGTLMQEAPYKDGTMHGIAKWYDEDGKLSLAYEYDNGELVDQNPDVD